MGRPRKHNKHLPRGMLHRHGAYYLVVNGKWNRLASEYGPALIRYAELVGNTPTVVTVADAVSHYLESSAARLRPATLEGYRNGARRLAAVFGRMALSDLTAAHVYRYLVEHGTVQANRDRALLSAAYSHARRIGAFIGDDPTKRLQFRNPEIPRQRYVTDAEFAALIAAAPPRLGVILRFVYTTGMRIGDALAMPVDAITSDGIAYQQRKTGARLLIEITPDLRALLEDIARTFRRFGRRHLFESRPTRARTAGPYTVSGLRANFRRALAKAGLPHMTLHDLRRKAGSDIEGEHATRLLGHRDAKVTQRHYRAKPERVKPVL